MIADDVREGFLDALFLCTSLGIGLSSLLGDKGLAVFVVVALSVLIGLGLLTAILRWLFRPNLPV